MSFTYMLPFGECHLEIKHCKIHLRDLINLQMPFTGVTCSEGGSHLGHQFNWVHIVCMICQSQFDTCLELHEI